MPLKIYLYSLLLIPLFLSAKASGNAEALNLDGIWKTNGYGYLFTFNNNQVELFELTDISCLPSGLSTGVITLNENSTPFFPVNIAGFIDTDMEIHGGDNADKLRLHRTDTNTFMEVERLASLPKQCLGGFPAASPYAVFRQSFSEHYPFFADKGIDWQGESKDSTYTGQVLFEQLTALVTPLNDAHIALIAPAIDGYYFGNEQTPHVRPSSSIVQKSKTKVNRYLNNNLQYTKVKSNIGYLNVRSFTDYVGEGMESSDKQALNQALPDISEHFKTIDGLIIDVRENTGGSDKLAILLASLFTDKSYLAYYKQAKNTSEQNSWTTAQATWVEPPSNSPFTGPVVLLTGGFTVSAGETFTMALMERLPKVTRLGQNTRGSFSDMLPRILSNGWLFALPNERYLDKANHSYDISGIPPHVTVKDSGSLDISMAVSLIEKQLAD